VVHADRGRIVVDLTVLPMQEEPLRGLLLVAFQDADAGPKPAAGSKAAQRRLPVTLGRELARTKEQLHAVVCEMEASHARIEATNEELQSANEELQSANEELTTSKEELQSLNEELMTLNAELEATNTALTTANDDLRNLLNSTKIPTLFLDNALRLKRFTSEATRVANVIAGDVGRAITDITLKVNYQGLARDVEEVLTTLVFKEVQLDGADQTSYTMRIHPYRTMTNMIDGVVITFSEVTALRRAEQALAANAQRRAIARLLDRWSGLVCVRDLALGEDIYLNERAAALLRSEPAGACFQSLYHPDDAAGSPEWRARLQHLRDTEVAVRPIRLRTADGTYGHFLARESVLARSVAGAPTRMLAVIEPSAAPT
jgi:two-component system CheB/CheR fusion protein